MSVSGLSFPDTLGSSEFGRSTGADAEAEGGASAEGGREFGVGRELEPLGHAARRRRLAEAKLGPIAAVDGSQSIPVSTAN